MEHQDGTGAEHFQVWMPWAQVADAVAVAML